MDPVQTKYFERSEGTLAYSDYGGSGELVLMLPGMGALRSEYRYLAPRLSKARYRAVTVDLRGHGESSVPWEKYDVASVGADILALVDHLGAGSAHLIATSFSAGSAVWAAAENAERIRSLVLIGAFVRDANLNPLVRAGAWFLMNNPWRVPLWTMYYRTLYPGHKPPDLGDYLKQLRANLSQPGRFHAAKALANSSRKPSEARLQRVKAPTLLIMGTKDPDFREPMAEGKYIAEQTGGELALVKGAGHYPQTEMPVETAQLILDFLERVLQRVPLFEPR